MKDLIKVAIVQPKPYPSYDDPHNVVHALFLLDQCRGEQLDVVCLPEYFPFQGEEELAKAARRLRAYVVAGLVEEDNGLWYNTATLFDREGRILGRQRKLCVGSLERNLFGISPGDGTYRAFVTDFGKIGIPICIDFWGHPEAARQLAKQEVDVIFNPSIFPLLRGHWKCGALVRAFDHFVPVVGVNTASFNAHFRGRKIHHFGGHSFVIQPPRLLDKDHFRRWIRSLDTLEEWVTVELDEFECVKIVEVDLRTCRRFRGEFRKRFGLPD
ncbi:carbon-nitrogen hydrolase family protein [Thermodesulforhabdus norvegica]|uniref:Predicted amidohydrolase n=1 Tax=Thermodesulforhabdus norvegica TaxID=39841 RepID=A0A1I4S5F3_9BACT|nr:carbon-nitrogen hydrolase family protein [Thermodesulforhabdus norvegica]SFM59746.1 Predicted amidohydrolase [Thermodesulforhabdus norvegica]